VIYILTGPVHSGKTTLLKNTIPLLLQKDFRIDGYLSESVWKNNECQGYKLVDLKEHQAHPFITKKGKEGWQKAGPYYFVPESLSKAKEIIRRAISSELAVIDEVGPLELAGRGVWPALAKTVFSAQPDFFLVIRDSVLEQFLSILKKDVVLVYTVVEKITPPRLAASLREKIEKRRQTRPL
jgi:iron complex transport system ATP-binding protein